MKPGQVSVNGMLAISTRDREVRRFLRTEYRHLRRVVGLDSQFARGAILRSLGFALYTNPTRYSLGPVVSSEASLSDSERE